MGIRKSSNLQIAGLALCGFLTGVTVAYADTAGKLPSEHVSGSVTYLSGGVGEGEADAIKQSSSRYLLELVFVAKGDDGHDLYLAGNQVTIRDNGGRTVLATVAQGPFLLANLRPGRYTVTASYRGESRERQAVIVADKHVRLVFEW